LVPATNAQKSVYLVLDNFGGRLGHSWRETDEGRDDREAVLIDLMDGQYNDPIRVVAFNTAEGWSRDASREIADQIALNCERDGLDIPPFLRSFVEQHRSATVRHGS
jgi:hypothetical protein